MSGEKKLRVLVADDHLVLRLGLVTLINDQPDMQVIGQAGSGQELLTLFRTHHPDVVLMDLRMPGLSGADTISALVQADPAARILVLTIHKGDDAVYQALRAGARGYLLKDVSSQEVLSAIRAVAAGEQCIPPAIAARLAERMLQGDLTAGEMDVLRLVAQGLSNKEIGDRLHIAPDTAKKRISGLLAKLGTSDRTRAVTLALERGIIDLDEVTTPPTLPPAEER
jgi:two-component system NarL family response regulator